MSRFYGLSNREEASQTALLTMQYTACCKELLFSQSTIHKKIIESVYQSIYVETKRKIEKLMLAILFVQNLH